MPEYLSNKKRKQSIGINSYSEYTDTTKIIGNVLVGFGSVGVGTTVPTQDVDVNTIRVRDTLYDYTNSGGQFGYYLTKDTDGIKWVAVPPIDSNAIFVAKNNNIVGVSSFTGLNFIADDLVGVTTNLINSNFADITIVSRWLKSGDTGIYTTKNVGIGTTIPTTDFQVGFGTTGVTIDGSVGVVSALGYYGNYAFIDQITVNDRLNVVGLGSTLVAAFLGSGGGITTTGGDLYVGGSLFSNKLDILNLKVVNIEATGITTLNVGIVSTFRVTGVSTLGVTSTKDLFVDANLKVSGIATLGVTTISQLNVSGITTLGITTISQLNVSGVSTFGGRITGIISTATKLENPRIFEITGDVAASPIFFDGTGNVSFAATIQPNSVELGADTFGDYLNSISGTIGQIIVTGGTGEGSTPVISFDPNPTIGGNVTIGNNLQVTNNLNVDGNITIGGTSATLNTETLTVTDSQILLGVTTSSNLSDISTDITANTGGIAIASTEGNPLVNLTVVGIDTLPATYKRFVWVSAGTFAGLGTDAWLSNYAIGIGSTQFPAGTRLAVGSVQFTENDLAVVRNINSSGVSTLGVTSTTNLTSQQLNVSGITTLGVTSTTNLTTRQLNVTGILTASRIVGASLSITGISTIANFLMTPVGTGATVGGIGVTYYGDGSGLTKISSSSGYADTAGIATNVIGGIASVTSLNVTGITTLASIVGTSLSISGISTLGITSTTNLTSQQLNVSGITTLGITSTTNLTSRQLNVSGITTLGVTTAQQLYVSGVSTFVGVGTFSGNLYVGGDLYVADDLVFDEFTARNIIVTGISTLNVGIVSTLTVSGISTLGVTSTTNLTSQQLNVSGITTLASIVGTSLSISGISTLGVTSTTNLTSQQLNVSGITTLGVTSTTNLTSQQLNVSGITTLRSIVGTSLSITGISTIANFLMTPVGTGATVGGIGVTYYGDGSGLTKINLSSVVGVVTYAERAGIATNVIGGIASVSQLNVTGITTLASIVGTSLSISGISTLGITSTTNLTSQQLRVTGISTLGVTSTTNLTTQQLLVTGITTLASIVGTSLSISGISTLGITSTTNLTSQQLRVTGITTLGVTTITQLYVSGVSTFSDRITGIISTAAKLETQRTFEITGDVVASPIFFDGTGNVSLAATIQANSVGLGTDTFGDYVKNITETANQITVTAAGGISEGSSLTLSIPNQFTAPQDVTVTRDLQVNRDLNVSGNITVGGTAATLFTQTFKVYDADIVLGVRTDGNGNDISKDNSANHGGIAIASTEGNALVNLTNPGIGETLPATYKKFMWFKAGSFGIGTDAWLSNYAIGIGSTQFPTGTRLAAGSVQFTENDLAVVRNINASGIITASTFKGTLIGYASSAGIATNIGAGVTGSVPYQSNIGITSFVPNATENDKVLIWKDGIPVWGSVSAGSISGTTDYANKAGIATYATNAGIATNLKGGLTGNIPYQSNTDTTTFVDNSSATPTQVLRWNGSAPYWGSVDAGSITGIATYADRAGIADNVIGGIASVSQLNVSGITTLGITSTTNLTSQQLLVTGITTLASIVGTSLSISGISTLGVTSTTNLTSQQLNVSGITTLRSIVGTSLSITGISTIANFRMSPVGTGATVGGIGVTYYGDGSGLTHINLSSVVGVVTYAERAGIATNVIGGIASVTSLNVTGITTLSSIVGTSLSISGISTLGITSTTNLTTQQLNVTGITTLRSIVGTSLSISGISTIANFRITNVGAGATVGGIGVTYYGDGSNLTGNIPNAIQNIDVNAIYYPLLSPSFSGTISSITVSSNSIVFNPGTDSLGIGTTNPRATLNVVPTSSNIAGLFSGTTSSDMVRITQLGTGNALVVEDSTNPDATPFVVNASGNLGIGTNNPTVALQLSPNAIISNVGSGITLAGTVGSALTVAQFYYTNTNASYIRIKATRNTVGSDWLSASTKLVNITDVTEQGYIEYNPNGALYGMAFGSGATEWARFLQNGNLGIGRTNPSSKLEVLGTIAAYSADTTSVGSFAISNAGLLDITSFKSTGGTLRFITANSSGTNLDRGRVDSSGNFIIGSTSATGTASQPLQVTGGAYVSGNLGVGTTNPTSKLTVVGDVLISGILTAANIVGTSLSITGISTIANFIMTPVGTGATVGGIGVTYYGDGSGLTHINLSSVVGVVTYAERAGIATNVIGGIASVTQLNVSGITTISVNSSSDALRITQTGTGNALVVEDSTNPDATPFVVRGDGSVGIGTTNPNTILHLQSNSPIIQFIESDAATNNRSWNYGVSSQELYLQALTDAGAGGGNLFKFTRSNEQIQTFEGLNSGVTWFEIDNANQRVGVGTSIASAVLDVRGNPWFSPNTTGVKATALRLGRFTDGVNAAFDIITDDNTGDAIEIQSNRFAGSLNFSRASPSGIQTTFTLTSNYLAGTSISIADTTGTTTKIKLDEAGNTYFNNTGAVLVGTISSTGTASQALQVTGGAYVSGNLGVGTINPTSKLTVQGDVLVSGILTASSIVGTSLSISGISTIANFLMTPVGTGATVGGIGVTYYGDGRNLTNIVSGYATTAGIATYADTAGVSTTSNYATNAGVSTTSGYATNAGIATYADTAGVSTTSNYATNAGVSTTSGYATNSGIATYAGIATNATNVIGGIASVTSLNVTGITTLASIVGTSLSISGISTIANFRITNVGTGATVGGVGVLTYYGDGSQLTGIIAGVSISTNTTNQSQLIPYVTGTGSTTGFGVTTLFTYNPSSGNLGIGTTTPTSKLTVQGDVLVSGVLTATRLYSGIYGEFVGGSISGSEIVGTSLSITGISTLGSVKISSGIITATTGIVTYYGDGSYLTNVVGAFGGIGTAGGTVGTGITFLDFRGSGISSITVSSGIATITIPGASRSVNSYTAEEGDTSFLATYTPEYADVYLNGSKLSETEYTASNGTSIILTQGASAGDIVEIVSYFINITGETSISPVMMGMIF